MGDTSTSNDLEKMFQTKTIDEKIKYSCYIKNLTYKGFHPFEKKKIIKKINLLIDKFNKVNDGFCNEGAMIVSNETNDEQFNKLLKAANLSTYAGILLAYNTTLNVNSFKIMFLILTNYRDNFKKFIETLATSGKKIDYINKEVENNKYWKCYSGDDANHLKLNESQYNILLKKFINELTSAVRDYAAATIKTIKNFLIDKENRKIDHSIKFLTKLEEGIEKKEKDLSDRNHEVYKVYCNAKNNDIKKLKLAFKNAKNILQKKSGNLLNAEIGIIEKYLESVRVPEINTITEDVCIPGTDVLKKKYFLPIPTNRKYFFPMLNSNDNTKKTMIHIMSAEVEKAGGIAILDDVTDYIRSFEKKQSKSNQSK